MATRDGCNNWCSMQAEYYGANCCGQAFFGTYEQSEEDTYFISYCALYAIEDGQIDMPIMDDGSGITAFSSTLMPELQLEAVVQEDDEQEDDEELVDTETESEIEDE